MSPAHATSERAEAVPEAGRIPAAAFDQGRPADEAYAAFGIRLVFAIACDPLPTGDLAPGERARYDALGHAPRRGEWLRGRAALKSVLRVLGNSEDTSLIAFPHACVSLTHSAGLAVAVGCGGSLGGLGGLGIDYEARRPMRAGSERFFLTDSERLRLGQPGEDDLLRLWTVKEALFKADPGNREAGRNLWSYEIPASLHALIGAAKGPSGSSFRYFTSASPEGFLSVALHTHSGAQP